MRPAFEPSDDVAADLPKLLGREPASILYVGAHQGHTITRYAHQFPHARITGFEPHPENRKLAELRLAQFGDRIDLVAAAVSNTEGLCHLNVNSHDATHSLYAIGQQRYWEGFAKHLDILPAVSVTLDKFAAERGITHVDLLQMDIQGAELLALEGAEYLLRQKSIDLIICEVEMFELYENQPLFWNVGKHLAMRGYHLYSLYNRHYHSNNPRVLSWADGLFIGAHLLHLPEHVP